MSKYLCTKCGSEDFVAKSEDEYYMELDYNEENNFLEVKIVDEYVLGDIQALNIKCQKCGTVALQDVEPDDSEWNWDNE